MRLATFAFVRGAQGQLEVGGAVLDEQNFDLPRAHPKNVAPFEGRIPVAAPRSDLRRAAESQRSRNLS